MTRFLGRQKSITCANTCPTEMASRDDGKSARHSFDSDQSMLHMVSAYATEARLVLAQEKVAAKSNEITPTPALLEWLDLKATLITIDAMGCQSQRKS